MPERQIKPAITIFYPGRPGYVLEAYKLQQRLSAQFGVLAVMLEGSDDLFKVVVNKDIIYAESIDLTKDTSQISRTQILDSVSKYTKPFITGVTIPPEKDDSEDPDHIEWMNSVCSGE